MPPASGPVPAAGNDVGNGHRRDSERLDQTGRFLPFASIAFGLGQCSDAPLGPVADVLQFGLLPGSSKQLELETKRRFPVLIAGL